MNVMLGVLARGGDFFTIDIKIFQGVLFTYTILGTLF